MDSNKAFAKKFPLAAGAYNTMAYGYARGDYNLLTRPLINQ